VASSDKAYGHATTLPYTEDMPVKGRHPYDVSKSCTDLIAMTYAYTYGLPVAVARCGNIYGGGDLNWSRIVPGTIRSFWLGQRPIIRSNGLFTRDYIYVQDVVNAYLALAERCMDDDVRGHAFNFSPERPMNVLELTGILQRLMRREDLEPDVHNKAQGEIVDQYLDSAKAHELLQWRATYRTEDALAHTIKWYVEFLESGAATSAFAAVRG
jgi:CDP-glucose 4,6-dehydratase